MSNYDVAIGSDKTVFTIYGKPNSEAFLEMLKEVKILSLEDSYMKLPLDSNGDPIHIEDKVTCGKEYPYLTARVDGIYRANNGKLKLLLEGGKKIEPQEVTLVKPPVAPYDKNGKIIKAGDWLKWVGAGEPLKPLKIKSIKPAFFFDTFFDFETYDSETTWAWKPTNAKYWEVVPEPDSLEKILGDVAAPALSYCHEHDVPIGESVVNARNTHLIKRAFEEGKRS